MINLKSLNKKALIITSLTVIIGLGSILVFNYNKVHNSKVVSVISNVYTSEVKEPEWITKNADFIIIGEVMDKDNPVKAESDEKDSEDIVYRDTNIKVLEILKNKEDETIKADDIIAVRTLGGTVDNLTTDTDTKNLLPDTGLVMLYLSDISNYPSIPQTGSDKKLFSVVGQIHGAFDIAEKTIDGDTLNPKNILQNSSQTSDDNITLKRTIVGDEFKLSELKKIIQQQN